MLYQTSIPYYDRLHANGHGVLIRNRALPLILNTRLQPICIHDVLRVVGHGVSPGGHP